MCELTSPCMSPLSLYNGPGWSPKSLDRQARTGLRAPAEWCSLFSVHITVSIIKLFPTESHHRAGRHPSHHRSRRRETLRATGDNKTCQSSWDLAILQSTAGSLEITQFLWRNLSHLGSFNWIIYLLQSSRYISDIDKIVIWRFFPHKVSQSLMIDLYSVP